MNEELIKYINYRITANRLLLEQVKPENSPIIENAITELEGVLEIAKVVPSRTSQKVKIDGI